MNPLSGQAAIITGGGTGIGRDVALSLAQNGARVAICGRRQAPLDETVSAIVEALGESMISANGTMSWRSICAARS